MEHDHLCPDYKHPHYGEWNSCFYCQCTLIHAVRQDERNSILKKINE